VNILRLVIKNSFEDRMMKFLRKKYHHNDHKKTTEGGGDGNDDDDDNVDDDYNDDNDGHDLPLESDDDDDDDDDDAVVSSIELKYLRRIELEQLRRDNTKDVPQSMMGIVDTRLYVDNDNNNGGGSNGVGGRSDGEGDGYGMDGSDSDGDSAEEEEKNEIGPVGNLFREKAEIMTEEFDLLFGVDSIVKQQIEDGVAPDQIGSAEDGGTAPAPDHTASSFAPDHVVS
jgi:hypothetical protein